MSNLKEQYDKYNDSFKLSPQERNHEITPLNSKEEKSKNIIMRKHSLSEEQTNEIITKFDKLLNKEEYYNFQERVYKLNKALTSIANSQNLNVSSFNSSGHTPENTKRVNSDIDISPNKLLKMLDELITEKEAQEKSDLTQEISSRNPASNENQNHSFTGSSSEEDETSSHKLDNINDIQPVNSASSSKQDNFSKKKKKLFKYLYNYELLYKTFLFEKSLNRIETESQSISSSPMSKVHPDEKLIGEEIGMNFGLLSNLSKNNKFSTNVSYCDSSLTSSILKSQKDKSMKFDFGTSTPSINKFFFEEKEFLCKIEIPKRRSMEEEPKMVMEKNPESVNHRRRSDFLQKFSQPIPSQGKKKTSSYISSIDDSFVSRFDSVLNDEDDHRDDSVSTMNTSIAPNLPNYQKRSSVFKEKYEKQYFLSNIYENDEYLNKSENHGIQRKHGAK